MKDDESGLRIRELAEAVLETHGQHSGIKRAVAELINSRGDTLSDDRIIEELEAILSGGRQWSEVYAQAK